MSIRKIKGLESDFTIVPNQTINDKLSWAARGMLIYLCSKPDDWEVSITDLVNQTTGSAKRSGRDAVRKIMDELIECGYMRKTQKRIAGKFDNTDHEVSLVPFTENPYTANPSTANPTQQSKDITKERLNKTIDTQTSLNDVFFVDQLSKEDFEYCHEAMGVLSYYKDKGHNIYTGSMSIGDWQDCENQMSLVDFDSAMYFKEIEHRFKSIKKKSGASLKDLLFVETKLIDFEQFYSKIGD